MEDFDQNMQKYYNGEEDPYAIGEIMVSLRYSKNPQHRLDNHNQSLEELSKDHFENSDQQENSESQPDQNSFSEEPSEPETIEEQQEAVSNQGFFSKIFSFFVGKENLDVQKEDRNTKNRGRSDEKRSHGEKSKSK